MADDYVFSSDWTSHFIKNAESLFGPLKGQPISYLEIGIFEGRSAVWMLDNILTHPQARYCGVDLKLQTNGRKNLERHAEKVTIYEGDSKVIVPRLNEKFDIVYVDGDHRAMGCLFDSVAAWNLATRYVIWDDYRQFQGGGTVYTAVTNFMACIPRNEYRIVVDNFQFGIEKLS